MEITVFEQILTGNLNDGFNLDAYLEELDKKWTDRLLDKYPDAQIKIEHYIQNASGYSRPLEVIVRDVENDIFEQDQDIADLMNHDSEILADDPRWYE